MAANLGEAHEVPGGWFRRRRRWVLPAQLRFLTEVSAPSSTMPLTSCMTTALAHGHVTALPAAAPLALLRGHGHANPCTARGLPLQALYHLQRGVMLGSAAGHPDERALLHALFMNAAPPVALRMLSPALHLLDRASGQFNMVMPADIALWSGAFPRQSTLRLLSGADGAPLVAR